MRNTRKIVLISLIAGALAVAAWLLVRAPRAREPVYAGITLSQWLETYNPISGTGRLMGEAEIAILQMDTNAIPALLHILETRDTPFKLWFVHLAEKQHIVSVHHVPEMTRYLRAAKGFEALGVRGHGAIPQLIQIYDRNVSSNSQQVISYILSTMGPAAKSAVPSLVRELNSTNDNVRLSAANALGQIGSEPEKVVPALTKMVKDDNKRASLDALAAAAALAKYGSAAKPAVPALLEYLTNNPPPPRSTGRLTTSLNYGELALGSLERIDPDAAAKFKATNNASLPR